MAEDEQKEDAGPTEEENQRAERRAEIEKILSPEYRTRLDAMDHKQVVPMLYQAAQDLLAELRAHETPAEVPEESTK